MIPSHLRLLPVLTLAACASTSASPAPSPRTSALAPADPRCVALADSLGAAPDFARLALAAPRRPVRPPRLAADVAAGGSVVVTVLVRADGTADTTRLELRGTRDAKYADEVRQVLARTRFHAVVVDGCAVPSRFTLVTTRTRTAGAEERAARSRRRHA
jgi:hypothetical protein